MEEVWKQINGSGGRYLVSNKGRIKSVDWPCKYSDGTIRIKKGGILKPCVLKCGYAQVRLQYKGKRKHFYLHRLVAETFIENPHNLLYINHKDENKLNNSSSNLEWCTFEYNINYGTRNRRAGEKVSGKKNPHYKFGGCTSRALPIRQYTMEGAFIKDYDCAATAMRETGIDQNSIRQVARGMRKSAGGYLWKNIINF